ncbi:MAG TPA: M14 family metallopeptidase [Casimicrobiaceae bacterium]|jgi:hypothetical protein|nr:M14 family metallopeptidase [Casimicrobiaceae bacterium]
MTARSLRADELLASFSSTYAEARDKFHEAARSRGLGVTRYMHPTATGAEGEELSVDVALLGDPHARSLLVVLSGMHGVEGFCGSGCQIALLRDETVLAAVERGGVAVLLYHAVNPYGFSHLRRTNEDNVDLNRNFRDFSRPQPPGTAYAEVHSIVMPPTWPPDSENNAALLACVAKHGESRLQAMVSSGQCDFPDGLFYGGRAPAWSNTTLRQALREFGGQRERLGWIDIHTGLGPWGHGEKIHSGPDDPAMIARARAWFGNDVTSFYDGSSTSAEITGVSFHAPLDACPHAQYTGIGLEFGTQPFNDVFQALRADQWLANHPSEGAAMRPAIARAMRAAFHDGSHAWKGMVHGQARVAVLQAIHALR